MDLKETSQMSRDQEMRHWWIRTRFLYIERALASLGPGSRVLEVGCGTGQNLRFLRTESGLSSRISQLVGFDPGLPPHALPPQGFGPNDQIQRELPDSLKSAPFDALIATDVIEHLDDDVREMRHWMQLLKPGARIVITVPAFPLLWSRHDELLGHRRRYTASTLKRFGNLSGLREVSVRYAFGPLFPAVFLIRTVVRRWLRMGSSSMAQTDLQMPPFWVNRLLTKICTFEFKLGGSRWIGTSAVGVFEKPL